MKLVWYEWKKLWKYAGTVKLFLFLILLSGLLFQGEADRNSDWLPQYLQIHRQLSGCDRKELSRLLNQDEAYAGPEQIRAWERIRLEAEALDGYEDYRKSVRRRYNDHLSISIFSGSSKDSGYRKRVADTYDSLRIRAPMLFQPYLGLEQSLDFYAGDFLALVFLIYLVSIVFIQEEKTGKTDFASTMIYGKTHFFLAKATVVLASFLIFLLASFFLILYLGLRLTGPVSFSAAIQSIPDYYGVPFAWTIGCYLLAAVLLKLLAGVLLTVLATAFARRSGSVIFTAAGMAALCGISIWACGNLKGEGIQTAARIWNVWSLLRGKPVIGTYDPLWFGTVTIDAIWGLVPGVILAGTLLFVTVSGQNRQRGKSRNIKKCLRKRLAEPRSLLFYELKKLWVYQGGIVLFMFCIIIQTATVMRYRYFPGTDEYYYHQYVDHFGDRITDQTAVKIAEESALLQKLEEQLALEDDAYRADLLQRQLERKTGFELYVRRMEALLSDDKEEIFLKDAWYRLLFEHTQVSQTMVAFLCVSLAFLVPAAFRKEKESRMEILQKTSFHGAKKLWDARTTAFLSYLLPFIIVSEAVSFYKAVTNHEVELMAPSDCLTIYWDSPVRLPVWALYLAGLIVQCASTCGALLLISAAARRVKNQYLLTGVILAAGLVPTMLAQKLAASWPGIIHDFFFIFTYQSYGMAALSACILAAALAVSGKERTCG